MLIFSPEKTLKKTGVDHAYSPTVKQKLKLALYGLVPVYFCDDQTTINLKIRKGD